VKATRRGQRAYEEGKTDTVIAVLGVLMQGIKKFCLLLTGSRSPRE